MMKRAILIVTCLGILAAWMISPPARTDGTPDALTADGGRYFGKLGNGKLHGRGRVEWENGAHYEGDFADGLFSGKGRFRFASGDVYEGQFKNGLMEGSGRMRFADGSVHTGEYRKGAANGNGRQERPEGSVYEGSFENGYFQGHGRHTWEGNTYVGEFLLGRMHGKGRYEAANGEIYEGDFEKDKFAGQGRHTLKDGARHEGRFADWRPHGAGRYTDAGGLIYEGEFSNGELNSRGRLTGKDGWRYEGEFKNGRFHGQGLMHLPNGDVYKGSFANGVYEGEGTLTYAKSLPDGRTQERGIWRDGALEDAQRENLAIANVETALYNQRALLDKALRAIEARNSGKINLYMLSIAGDGTQEVFRREVDFVNDLFARQFGTKGRALALINSRNTVATQPMATVTSIRESLQGIAQRMDKHRDILFLFITSHGSKEHEISLDQEKIRLRDLPAQALGQMVKETGIRWKVILISACYGGGFIDPLKDEHTLIMTAARRDRRSFGCSDENDFPYFGRAFFKESLPVSTSFQDAFRRAEKLVREWERKDLKANAGEGEYSLPQMVNPTPVDRYLRQWWGQLEGSGRARESTTSR